MALTTFFYVYSALLPLMPLGCLLYFVLQTFVVINSQRKFKDKKMLLFLFLTYLSAFLCGLTGYSMHIIPSNSIWCEKYGMAFCFSFLGGTKACLYFVFLQRAKRTVIQQFNSSKLKEMIFDYIVPCYLLIYYLIYCSLTYLFFKGGYYDLTKNDIDINSKQISFCAFKSWESRFVIVASSIDFMNSVIATLAFVIPLYKILKLSNVPDREINITNAMKWDVMLTFIATISSAISLCMLNPMTGGWMWCFCLVDPIVNSSCCFFMMGINREFVAKYRCCRSSSNIKKTSKMAMKLSIFQSKNSKSNTKTNVTTGSVVTTTINPTVDTVPVSDFDKSTHGILRTGGLKSEITVIGWTRNVFKNLEMPPMNIIQLISMFYSQEESHWIEMHYDKGGINEHFVINTQQILSSVL